MEAIIFTGIQASGKTTFYQQRFARTHLMISLDMLKHRYRQDAFIQTCAKTAMRFVVDNTQVTADERSAIIARVKPYHFRVIGYYFVTTLEAALARSEQRPGKQRIPEKGLRAMYKHLQIPVYGEGFDELWQVSIGGQGEFVVEEMAREI
jgi:predicted kinase